MKYFLLFCLISINIFLFAQDAFESRDSLHILQDEKLIFSDNLQKITEEDSSKYNIAELHTSLNKYFKNIETKKTFIPPMIHNENFHFQAPFKLPYHFSKNGFTVIPHKISNLQIYQNYSFAHKVTQKGDIIFFEKDNYDLPIPLTNSFLGLGANNMNHAGIDFRKGDIWGQENLNLQFSFLGQDGKWLGIDENSKIFDLHLHYSSKFGTFHFFNSTIDQRISSSKLYNSPELAEVNNLREYVFDNAVLWENDILNLGWRYEKSEIDSCERKLAEFLIKKELFFNNHNFVGSFEYFTTSDSNFYYLNFAHSSNYHFLELTNNSYFRDKSNYLIFSKLSGNIFSNFCLHSGFTELKNRSFYQKYWSEGVSYKSNFCDIEMQIGINENFHFWEFKNRNKIQLNSIEINLANYFLMDENGVKTLQYANHISLPKYQTKTSLEFIYFLHHNNSIKFVLEHNYLSKHKFTQNMSDETIEGNSSQLDAQLELQITKQFTIGLAMMNLTNTSYLFSYPTAKNNLETHFNLYVNWIFLN